MSASRWAHRLEEAWDGVRLRRARTRTHADLRIELYPERPPEGYPWHAYYGARFAWRDERATLLRGVVGQGSVTTHTRPVMSAAMGRLLVS